MINLISRTAIWTYGLAFLGVHLAFMPLLVLLLPRRIEAVAGDDPAAVLSVMLLVGGVVAGISNVAAGAMSDWWMARFGSRRGLIVIGVVLLFTAYIAFAFAQSEGEVLATLVYFQLTLNCCFAPLGVLLSDHFADEVKGRFGGLSNAALPASTLLVAPIAWVFPQDDSLAFVLVGAIAVLCIVPLLITWKMGEVIGKPREREDNNIDGRKRLAIDLFFAWTSRLLVQTGAAFALGYIYLYIAESGISGSVPSEGEASEILALLTVPAAVLAVIATLLGGTLSDLKVVRRIPLLLSAIIFAAGMGLLAGAPYLGLFLIGYALFQIGLSAFLSIDTALVAQLVGGNPRRGLLLGVMNLANTLPSIIAPTIALFALARGETASALSALFAIFAAAAVASGLLVLFIRSVR